MASGQALYCVLAVSRALGWTLPQRPCSQPSGSLRQVARCHLRRKQWAGRLTSLVCALGETGRLSEPAFAHMNKGLFKTCENSVKNLRNRRQIKQWQIKAQSWQVRTPCQSVVGPGT